MSPQGLFLWPSLTGWGLLTRTIHWIRIILEVVHHFRVLSLISLLLHIYIFDFYFSLYLSGVPCRESVHQISIFRFKIPQLVNRHRPIKLGKSLSLLLSRPGPERPRVGPSGDEELPEWNARVQIWHERQDRHRQAGQGRSDWWSREEVSDRTRRVSRRPNEYLKSTCFDERGWKFV